MGNNNWNTTILRTLTHSIQMPYADDFRVNTYSALIQSLLSKLSETFTVEDVERKLKEVYGFENVSKLLISKALLHLSQTPESEKEMIVSFEKSHFPLFKEETTPFNELTEMLIQKMKSRGIEVDDHQRILVEELLECTFFQMSEAIEEVISCVYSGKTCLSEKILTQIINMWKNNIKKYEPAHIDKLEIISVNAIESLKILFTEKDKIGQILGIIGQIIVFRGFVCADPELNKLNKELFKNTFLLIDTNILISYLCQGSLSNDEIVWLLESSHDVGINICILDETIEEYKRTLLKDSIRHSMLDTKDDADLLFGERDIPLGYSRKWHHLGTWSKYINYLENGPELFFKKFNVKRVKSDIDKDKLKLTYLRIKESVRTDRYKEHKAIVHDAELILSGHKQREMNIASSIPSFILTREKKLIKVEKTLIENDGILDQPPMMISTDHLIEFLIPFFSQSEDSTKIHSILGKMMSNMVMNIDKKIFKYLMEYLAIETKLGEDAASKLLDLALDEYTLDKLILEREDQTTHDANIEFVNAIVSGLDKIDKSKELESKLERIVTLAKTAPATQESIPKIQSSVLSHLCQLFKDTLPIFLDPKPEDENELQREMNKLMRAYKYVPNWDTDQVTFSGRGRRPDFTLNTEKIAIEAKFIGEKTSVNTIIDEMAADTTLYSNDFAITIFIVYDKFSKISDEEIFQSGFESKGNVVIVLK